MSRVVHGLLGFALLLAPTTYAMAQADPPPLPSLPLPEDDDTSKTAPNLAERLLVAPREPRCDDNGQVGGINVCGKKRDSSKDRLPIAGLLNSATATGDGLPRAPDVMGNRITGHSIKFGCIVCPQGMLPDIDFKMMPPDPEGSDAERIGKGEIRGN